MHGYISRMLSLVLFLSIVFISCQKPEQKELKDCTSRCKEQFQQSAQDCGLKKSEVEKAECQMKAMTDSDACVAKCNEAFTKKMQ